MPVLPYTLRRNKPPKPTPARAPSDNVHPTLRRIDVERLLNDGILTEPARSALRYALEVVR